MSPALKSWYRNTTLNYIRVKYCDTILIDRHELQSNIKEIGNLRAYWVSVTYIPIILTG